MIDIESKIISYREDANDYRLCLTREEIEEIKNYEDWGEEYSKLADIFANKCREVRNLQKEIKQIRAEAIDECIEEINRQFKDGYGFGVTVYPHTICNILEQLKEQK